MLNNIKDDIDEMKDLYEEDAEGKTDDLKEEDVDRFLVGDVADK